MPLRTVLITGASTGIGAACAAQLAEKGVRVLAGVRRHEDGERVKAGMPELIHPVRLDVCDEASIQGACEAASQMAPDGLQGLVNNAGIAVGSPMEFVLMDRLRQQFEVNVFGLVRVTQVFLPLLRKGQGRIVIIGSVSGLSTTPLLGPYCASKHAVEAITDALRMELRAWNLEVSVIQPGAVATPIWDKGRRAIGSLKETLPEEALELYHQDIEAISKMVGQAEKLAVPPERVAEKVDHALFASKPKTRYLVGKTAWLETRISRWLPDRLRDRLVAKFLKGQQ